MNETERRKDDSKDEVERCLRYYEIRLKRSLRDPKFIMEGAGFIVLVIYALFTIKIYYANRDAADAATRAANTAQDSLVKIQRPWVGIVGYPDLLEPLKIGQYLDSKVKAILQNFGGAPATHVVMRLIVPASPEIGTNEIPWTCKIPEMEIASGAGVYIFPNNILPYVTGSQGNSGYGSKPVAGTVPFRVIGCIVYSDQFKTIHHTTFCYYSNSSISQAKPHEPMWPCQQDEEID